MSFNENLRGQTNSIILFILLNGDRHTDELKDLIDENFSTVKIGTLYSIISRMKTQGQITEYRASSNDGSRRKYYKITELGKKLFFDEYYELFEGVKLPEKEEPEKEVKTEPDVVDENEELYLKYIKKAETADSYGDIDFSSVIVEDSEKVADKDLQVKESEPEIVDNSPIFDSNSDEIVEEKGVDYDSVVSSEYEYKSVLNKLFPKSSAYSDENYYQDYAYTDSTNTVEPKFEPTPEPIVNTQSNFDTIYDLSEKENIKIRTSVDTNRYQGTKILVNKVRFHSAIILLLLSVLEYLLTSFIFASSVTFSGATLLRIAIIFGAFAVVMGIIYAVKYNHTVKDLPKFINSIELAIIITIGTVIISLCIASISGINMYRFDEVYNAILVPSIMSANLPIYVAIVHFLSKLDFYQTV